MAYAEAEVPLPPGDQYAIDGFDRELVKRAVNILFNATTRHGAVSAIVEELHRRNYPLWRRSGLATRARKDCWPLAKAVVAAIEEKHHRIRVYFGSDCGLRFQRRDSEMLLRVMQRMIARTGRCPLPLHDSPGGGRHRPGSLVPDHAGGGLRGRSCRLPEGLQRTEAVGASAAAPAFTWGKQPLTCADRNTLNPRKSPGGEEGRQ